MRICRVMAVEVGLTGKPELAIVSLENLDSGSRARRRWVHRSGLLGDTVLPSLDIDPNLYLVMNQVQDSAGIRMLCAEFLRNERLDPELEAIAFATPDQIVKDCCAFLDCCI